jgi:O-acetylhomoserine/O-acetylserine sulfhydrylase-like pyridoxal-dependent enzyme
MSEQRQPATTAITAGRRASGSSLAPALWASTVWESTGLDDAERRATGTRASEFYSRYANPTVRSFEEAIAALEGADDALAFASGMGAIATTVLTLCSAGDHIVAQRQLYAGTLAFLQGPCARFGIEVTFVDGTEPGAFAAAVRPGLFGASFAGRARVSWPADRRRCRHPRFGLHALSVPARRYRVCDGRERSPGGER